MSRSGDKVRITAQLIDARADRHLWAKSFERKSSDVLALQAELASAIAREINVRLTRERAIAAGRCADRQSRGARRVSQGPILLQSSERREPAEGDRAVRRGGQAESRHSRRRISGLSDAYLWAGYNEGFMTASEAKPKAKAAAEKAVQLDSNSAEGAHVAGRIQALLRARLGGVRARVSSRDRAQPELRASRTISSGWRWRSRDDSTKSIAEGKRAAELDPLSPQMLVDATIAFMFRKDSVPASQELARRAAELDPTYFFPVDGAKGGRISKPGHFREAIPLLEKATTMDAPPFVTAYLAYALRRRRRPDGRDAEARRARRRWRRRSGAAVQPGARLSRPRRSHARALDYLEQALAADSQMLAWLGQRRDVRSSALGAALRGAAEEAELRTIGVELALGSLRIRERDR